jgi:predicted MFS family arabinose efflux permease
MAQQVLTEGGDSEDPSRSRPPGLRAGAGSTFYALQSPAYRVLWLNSCLVLSVMHLSFTAHATVAFEITGQNSAVGLLSFAIGLAMLVTTPWAGAIADRMSKRLLLLLGETLLLVMGAGLAALLYADALTIELMLLFGFTFGASASFFWPAITACMGETVEPDMQSNGAALFQIALNLTRSFTPFIGAALLAWGTIGLGGTYVAVAILMVPTLASIALIPAPAVTVRKATRSSMLADMRLGLAHVRENAQLLAVMASFVVTILLAFSMMVVLPAFAKDVLGAGESGFGIMFGTHAVGGLIAGVFVASKAGSKSLNAFLLGSSLLLGVSVSLLAFMPDFLTALAMVLVVGGAAGAFQTLIMAAILRASAPEYFGRVMALTNVGWALNNLFGLVLGITADVSSERASLFALGVVILVTSVLLGAWRSRIARLPASQHKVPSPLWGEG